MAKAAGNNYYIRKGLREKKSDKREETESGKLAAFIIDKIPKDFDIYKDYDINEVHLAAAIVKTCGRFIRYCPATGWLVYRADEGRWTEKHAESAVQRVITHFGELLWEGAKETNTGETSFSRRILSSAGISAVKNILKGDTAIAVEQESFDAQADLLNCRGDCYDLRTGSVRPSEPEDMFAKSTLCKAAELKKLTGGGWELPALPEKFEKFMEKVTSKDGVKRSDLAFYLLFYFGYCLTGDNGASFFINLHGQGANGKSVLLDLMLELFGDYAAPLPEDLVIESPFQNQFNMAGLPGVRLGILADAPKGRVNMKQLKPIISGQKVNAQRKYLKDFTYKPVLKIVVGSNPKLTLGETGKAVQRRIRMVPFDYTIPEEEQTDFYHRDLLEEGAPEILSLLIWFAHEYYRKGGGKKAFPVCAAVNEASAEYIKSEDLVGRWKEERTEAAAEAEESATNLYEDFKKWAGSEGIKKVMTKSTFGECLSVLIPDKKRKADGNYYQGIKLKPGNALPGDGGG